MAFFIKTVGQILLLGFFSLTAANSNACQIYAALGASVKLPLEYEGLTNSNTLRWTHGNTTIFCRQQGKVTRGKPEDITTTGSIWLKSVKLQNQGTYRADVLHPNGTLAKTWTRQLCVLEKVSKPRLSFVCDTNAVNLVCHVAKPQDLVFSWTLDKKTLLSETGQNLSRSLSQLKEGNSFSCLVTNKVSTENSETVWPTCKVPTLCFKTKTVLGVLAGGIGLVALLLLIIIILCCVNRRTKTKMKLSEKEEHIMFSKTKFIDKNENQHGESCSFPSPQPSSKGCSQVSSKQDVKTESGLPELSTAAEGQGSRPVPKPRKINEKALNL
ncbi:T-cell surface antigen CD2-like [Fundulus diaphanus]